MEGTKKLIANLALGSSIALFAGFSAYQFAHVMFEGTNYIASINGKYITMNEYKERMLMSKGQYGKQMGVDFKTANGEKAFKELRGQILQDLVITKVMLANAEQEKISVSLDDVRKEIKKIKAENFKNNEAEFEKALKRNNISKDNLEKVLSERQTIQKLLEKMFERDLKVSDEELKKIYESSKDNYQVAEQVQASHILVKDEKLAKDLIEKINAGQSFDKLAKEYSQDPGSKNNGGDLGFFAKGMMVPEFEKACFSELKNGEITQKPVKTQFGFHIIKRIAFKPKELKSFEEVKGNMQASIRMEKQKAYIDNLRQKILAEADIKFHPNYQEYSFKPSEPAKTEEKK